GLVLAAVNQSAEVWSDTVTLRRMSVEGVVIGTANVAVTAERRSVAHVDVPRELEPAGPKEFLVAETGGLRALRFPAPDRDIPYPRPEFEVALVPGGVEVTAHTL